MTAGMPPRSESDLTEDERHLLAVAHDELRAAEADYERFLGAELRPGQPVSAVSATVLRDAQERLDAAKERIWELHEDLLGWARPSSVPSTAP